MKLKRCGQSTIETSILIIVIAMALVAMQVYIKRGMQGRVRANIESIGEQYDPDATTSQLTVTKSSTTTTESSVSISGGGSSGYETTSTTEVDANDNIGKSGWERVQAQ